MSEFSQKELSDLLKVGISSDSATLIGQYFGHSIDKYELFDTYKNIYKKQTIKNHLECYDQIRLLIFTKCLNEVKYTIIDAVKNIDQWSSEQMELFINTVIKNLFIKYDEPIIFTKDFDSIIKSYLKYKYDKDIDLHLFKTSKAEKYGIDDKDELNRGMLNVLIIYTKYACNVWKKELTEDQLKLIDIYRTYFLHKSPNIDFLGEISNPQYEISMDYDLEYSPEIYSIIFQLYLMGNDKLTKATSLRHAILDRSDPKETYEVLINNLWQWAQKEKGQSRDPSNELKEFCCDVLKVVCDNNSYSRYNSRDFLTVNKGWKLLRKANENIKRTRRTLNKYYIHPLFRV